MSTEGWMACAAIVGVLFTIAGVLQGYGRLTQRVDQGETDRARIEAELSSVKADMSAKYERLVEKVDTKLEAIWQFLHRLNAGRGASLINAPPLERDE